MKSKRPVDDPCYLYTSTDVNDLFTFQRYQYKHTGLLGLSTCIEDLVKHYIPECAKSEMHVLITGETGTGKEEVVAAIRRFAKIPTDRFRAVNCAAFSKDLLASELFGYAKGAFTGAVNNKNGILDAIDGGALFLDEIGTMPQELQAHILRVMQDGSYRAVGSTDVKTLKKGTRIFAATNDISKLREDVYQRFQERISLPPLRERISDVFLLIEGFLDLAKERKAVPKTAYWLIAPDTLTMLVYSNWSGNVRELKNAVDNSIARHEANGSEAVIFGYEPACGNLFDDYNAIYNLFLCLADVYGQNPNCSRDLKSRLYDMAEYIGIMNATSARFRKLHYAVMSSASDGFRLTMTLPEAVEFVRRISDFKLHDRIRKLPPNDEVNPDNYIFALGRMDENRLEVFPFPPNIAARYDRATLVRKPKTAYVAPDLTGYTEWDLLELYYTQLSRKFKTQKEAAKEAGLIENALALRYKKYI